jgi:hypothetical protein
MTTGFYEKYILPKHIYAIHILVNGKILCNMKYKHGIKTTLNPNEVTCLNCKRTYGFETLKNLP